MSRRLGAVVGAALSVLALCIGCDSTKNKSQAQSLSVRADAYHPEQFPDLPLPAGYVLMPNHDQVAVVIAGGRVRRFDVTMIQKEGAKAEKPADTLNDSVRNLSGLGWEAVAGDKNALQRRFRKRDDRGGNEELLVETGRADSRTTIHLRLVPLAPANG